MPKRKQQEKQNEGQQPNQKQQKMEKGGGKASNNKGAEEEGHKADPIVRVLAVHGDLLAAAVGPSIRLLNLRDSSHAEVDTEQGHTGAVRSLAFSPNGALLLSGSDDKTCKLWDAASRKCLATWRMHKKVSAVAFTRDNKHALFADKFGDVGVAACGDAAQQQPPSEQPELLLGHLCSIITSISVSADNRFVVTTDKDGRVRVSILPATPLKGAYEIQTYCFGHDSFVTTSAYVPGAAQQENLLLSGGGDGTVRLWDSVNGKLLHTFEAARPLDGLQLEHEEPTHQQQGQDGQQQAEQGTAGKGDSQQQDAQQQQGGQAGAGAGVSDQNSGAGEAGKAEGGVSGASARGEDGGVEDAGGAQENGEQDGAEPQQQQGDEEGEGDRFSKVARTCSAVIHVACSPDGSYVSASMEGEHEIQVLKFDHQAKSISLHQKLHLPEVFYPCQTAWDASGKLWVVGGPPCDSSRSIHIGAAKLEGESFVPCTSSVLDQAAVAAFERRNPEEEQQVASGQLVPACNKSLFRRRYLGIDTAGLRKAGNLRMRNDLLENERLAALRQQLQQQQLQQQQQQQQQ